MRFVFGFAECLEIEIESCFRLRGIPEVMKRNLFFDSRNVRRLRQKVVFGFVGWMG